MTTPDDKDRIGLNRARHAVDVCLERLDPLIQQMPERGFVGRARAIILECRMHLTAAKSEMAFADPEDTPVAKSPSQMMKAIKAGESAGVSGVRGLAARTKDILDEGSK